MDPCYDVFDIHQVMQFPNSNGDKEIKGDFIAPRKIYDQGRLYRTKKNIHNIIGKRVVEPQIAITETEALHAK